MRKILYLLIFLLVAYRFVYPIFASEQVGIGGNCEQPKNSGQHLYLLMFDESGSMGNSGINTLNKSYDALSETLLDGSQIMVSKFSDLLVGDNTYKSFNKAKLQKVINNIINYGKISRLYDSLYIAQKNIRTIADQNQLSPFIILFSDGFNQKSIIDYQAVKQSIEEYRVPLIIFAVDGKKDKNLPLLEELAALSCGFVIQSNINRANYSNDLKKELGANNIRFKNKQAKDSTEKSTGIFSGFSAGKKDTAKKEATTKKSATVTSSPPNILKKDAQETPKQKSKPSVVSTNIFKQTETSDKTTSAFSSTKKIRDGWPWLIAFILLFILLIFLLWRFLKKRKDKGSEVDEDSKTEPVFHHNVDMQKDEPTLHDSKPLSKTSPDRHDTDSGVGESTQQRKESLAKAKATSTLEPEKFSKGDLFDDSFSEKLKQKADHKLHKRSSLIEQNKERIASAKKRRQEGGDEDIDLSRFEDEQNKFIAPKSETIFEDDKFLKPEQIQDGYNSIQSVLSSIVENHSPELSHIIIFEYIASGAMNPNQFVKTVGKKNALIFSGKFPHIISNYPKEKQDIAIKALNMIVASCGFEYEGVLGDQNWKNFCDINSEFLPSVDMDHKQSHALAEQALKAYMTTPVPILLVSKDFKSEETVEAMHYNKIVFFSKYDYSKMDNFRVHPENNSVFFNFIFDQVQYYKKLDLHRYELKLVNHS